MSRNSHQQISVALDEIITKCGQNLYEKYLNQKLPDDCNDKVVAGVQTQFNVMTMDKPQRAKITRDPMPRAASADIITPMKVAIISRQNAQISKTDSVKFFTTEIQKVEKNKKKQGVESWRPNFCFSNSCPKGQIDYQQQRMRKQKRQSDQIKKTTQNSNHIKSDGVAKRLLLEKKIKELAIEGIPYAYDDEGNFIMPDPKTYKKDLQIQSKKKNQSKPFSLRFKALQMLSEGSEISSHCKLLGRKKGYSSTKQERKKKINEQQFSNKHQRQASAIPFMTIQSGIKIVEKDRNIMAERLHAPAVNRKQYVSQSRKSFFKSYMPGSDANSSNIDRPATHSYSRSKNFQSVGLSSGVSLHSRPKTSRQLGRVSINNKQLAMEMVREQTITACSRFV